ncbi:hypothetical protein Q3G72_015220 [Acer saccharum]|nr:hypothetical protein Q3G72_015220 [Acer saccharum]
MNWDSRRSMKLADTRIKTMLRRLKMQLLKDLSFLDAIFLRYEDGEEKSEAAAKELLADEAHEAETKKNNEGCDNMKQKQDKKEEEEETFQKSSF